MDRREFIEKLRMALSGSLPSAVVADYVNYYEDYISVEIRKGRTEEDVLSALGDPRLIAKTILQTNAGSADMAQGGDYYSTDDEGGAYHAYGDAGGNARYARNVEGSPRIFKIPGWIASLLVILVTMVVISVVFYLLSFLAPLILVIASVLFIVKLFRDWLN